MFIWEPSKEYNASSSVRANEWTGMQAIVTTRVYVPRVNQAVPLAFYFCF